MHAQFYTIGQPVRYPENSLGCERTLQEELREAGEPHPCLGSAILHPPC